MRLSLLALLLFLLNINSTPSHALLCGKAWQNACKVWEKVPSCDRGLVERGGKCFKPKARKKAKPKCGKLNERPCKVLERIPSCDRGLVRQQNKCRVAKIIDCGKVNHRPCKVSERVPTCDINLVENLQTNRCVRPVKCGRNNQRPCKIRERVPSCDHGLVEDSKLKKCVKSNAFSRSDLEHAGNHIVRKHKPALSQLKSVFAPFKKRAERLHEKGQFDRLMQEGNYEEIGRLLNLQQLSKEFHRQRQLAQLARSSQDAAAANFFDSIKSISIGFTPGATALAGLAAEWGIVSPVTVGTSEASIYGYTTYGFKVGAASGSPAGIAASVWLYKPKDLCGYAQVFTVGTVYGGDLLFAGWFPTVEQWHLYRNASSLPLYGLTMAGGGIDMDIDVNSTRSVILVRDSAGSLRCSECGSPGKRPCSIFERTPSCNSKLIEKHGACLKSSDTILPVPMQKLQ